MKHLCPLWSPHLHSWRLVVTTHHSQHPVRACPIHSWCTGHLQAQFPPLIEEFSAATDSLERYKIGLGWFKNLAWILTSFGWSTWWLWGRRIAWIKECLTLNLELVISNGTIGKTNTEHLKLLTISDSLDLELKLLHSKHLVHFEIGVPWAALTTSGRSSPRKLWIVNSYLILIHVVLRVRYARKETGLAIDVGRALEDVYNWLPLVASRLIRLFWGRVLRLSDHIIVLNQPRLPEWVDLESGDFGRLLHNWYHIDVVLGNEQAPVDHLLIPG